MVNNRLFIQLIIGIIFIVYPQLITCQRISDVKCYEYSKIPKTHKNPQPHMVWLRNFARGQYVIGELAILISDQFVLTWAVPDLVPNESQVYFTPNERYTIIERITHPFFMKERVHHNLALLRLDRKIRLDSAHRPACLWTKNYFETDLVEVLKWNHRDWTDEYPSSKMEIISDEDCVRHDAKNNGSVFCLKPTASLDNNYFPTITGPVQIDRPSRNLPDNHYLLGIVAWGYWDKNPVITLVLKLYHLLDWIETHVWPTRTTDVNCGRVQINFRPLITFSMPTFHGEFPWHAALYRLDGLGTRKYICGGTLLNELSVLTAAHCVSNEEGLLSPRLLLVSLGKYDIETSTIDTRESRVERILLHKQFNRIYLENDIAILQLTTHMTYSKYIQPICLADTNDIFPTDIGIVPGWGKNEFDSPENQLTKASLPVIPNVECRDSNRNVFQSLLNENNFCAGYQNGTSVCSGDSGGGLVINVNGQWFIRGIVSLGVSLPNRSQCDTTQLVLFTNVVNFYDWIVDNTLDVR